MDHGVSFDKNKANNMDMYVPTMSDAFIFAAGVASGYLVKTVRYFMYSPPNLTHRYTYKEIVSFVGGKPMLKKGALFGIRTAAIIVTPSVDRQDNTIFFSGSFHKGCSPADPGHQSIEYSLNKKMNEYKGSIHIFVKIRPNEYSFIGTGLRNGAYFVTERKARDVLVFPIRYVSGNLAAVMDVLGSEATSSSSSS